MDKHKETLKENKTFFTEWLEKLQQESWQLELLISGLALYGIFESKALLIDFEAFISLSTEGTFQKILGLLYLTLMIGRKLFLINLLIHIVLRGLWIGAIGLRYVSGDIDFNKLRYSERFTKYLKNRIGSYDNFIEKLEKTCSVLFAYTFLLFLLFFSVVLYFGILAILQVTLDSIFPISQYEMYYAFFSIIYLLLGLIVFIDFITLGGFKKIKENSVSKGYYVIYRLVSILTLSFLYRPLLYNFIDQKYTKRLFFFSIPYIFIIAFGDTIFSNTIYTYVENSKNLQESGLYLNDSFYQDLRDKSLKYKDKNEIKEINYNVPYIVLNKYYMDDPFPSFFLKMTERDKKLLKKNKLISPIYEEGVKFTLFENGKSKRAESLTDTLVQTSIDSLYEKRHLYMNSIRNTKRFKNTQETALLKIKLNALDSIIKSSNDRLEQSQKSIQKDNYINIKNTFMDYIDIRIDNVSYKDSLICEYYVHPSSGHKGFLCHFSSESISVGHHEISFKRTLYSSNKIATDSIHIYETKLPFIKIK